MVCLINIENVINSIKIRCNLCKGSGLMETEPIICKKCDGKICIYCERKGGLEMCPYETCTICSGAGEYTVQKNEN